MTVQFKDIYEKTQAGLRQTPENASASYAVQTRQIDGFRSEATARQFNVTVDEPEALGGADTGPSPVELLLAALGSCQEITYRLYADALGIPLDGVSVRLTGNLDLRGFFAVDPAVRPGYQSIEATVVLDSPAPDEDLARLRAEREASRRGMLPTLDLYGNYRLYGADQGQIGRTVENLSRRDASVAVALRWEFFSGFRDRLKLERIDVQMRRVSLQRRQKIAELRREIDTLRRTAQLRDSIEDHLRQRRQVNSKAADDDARLRTQGVLAENTTLEKEIDLMEDVLDADLLRIKRRADALRLRLWQQEAGS